MSKKHKRSKHTRSLFIPWAHYKCFVPDPSPIVLSTGTKLIRILKDTTHNPYGNWWMLETDVPKEKHDWRSKMAVFTSWNSGEKYIEISIAAHEQLQVWSGSALSQAVEDQSCFLLGGGNQIWIAEEELKKLKDYKDNPLIQKQTWY